MRRDGLMKRLLSTTLISAAGWLSGWSSLGAGSPADDDGPGWQFPTLGGTQFWSDELVHGEWRIQRNVVTEHYRLLDPENRRRCWGGWEACYEHWEVIRHKESVAPLQKKVVVVLHGLGRTRNSMSSLVEFLAQDDAYSILNVSYASTRESIGEHARSLARVIKHLDDVEQIDFVAHSMGNLVIRHFLADQMANAERVEIDARIHHIVMLAPPNQGADMAERLQRDPLFRTVFGSSGQQLGGQWEQLAKRLAVPPCPFGIIAGGEGDSQGVNPLLTGDDDMVVSVSETKLAGARDFVVVPCLHTFLMNDPQVQTYVRNFLRHGYFIAENQRSPLTAGGPPEPDSAP
jgi:pimeloyl-ACP methyl ester carboxylesterase